MTHRQALQGVPDTSQLSFRKNNKINFRFFFLEVPAGSCEVTGTFKFISERDVIS
jgi:hypothetical protein